MPNILIADTDEDTQIALKKHFEKLGNNVSISPSLDEAAASYENFIPDLVIMNYIHDEKVAQEEASKIIEFDHTACIFAVTNTTDDQMKKKIYASGARAVILKPEDPIQEKVDSFVDKMYEACEDLKLEKCIKCWEAGTFTDTT
ncbi:MAG: response regulator [Candidatus Kariarchaeaceae archaeon]